MNLIGELETLNFNFSAVEGASIAAAVLIGAALLFFFLNRNSGTRKEARRIKARQRNYPSISAVENAGSASLAELRERIADINEKDELGQTVLMTSIEKRRDLAEQLIQEGAEINAGNSDGQTPLMLASRLDLIDIVRMLLEKGADLNIEMNNCLTALDVAIETKNFDIARLLAERGATVTGRSLIQSLIRSENDELLTFLLEKGADVNLPDCYGETVLMYSTGTALAALLIGKGADLNKTDSSGMTALMHFARKGNYDLVDLLIRKGAIPDIRDRWGRNAMDHAVEGNNKAIVKLLEETMARSPGQDDAPEAGQESVPSIDTASLSNETEKEPPPPEIDTMRADTELFLNASREGNITILRSLLDKHVDVNGRDEDGQTALMCACSAGHREIVTVLIDKGADISVRNKDGMTALDLSLANERLYIAQLLDQINNISPSSY